MSIDGMKDKSASSSPSFKLWLCRYVTFLQRSDTSPFSPLPPLHVEWFLSECSDASHQLLGASLWANFVNTNTAHCCLHCRRCQSRYCVSVNAPQKTRRPIQAYHALCLSACQMRCMCPNSRLVCLIDSSCLSIHLWLCHSICLALGLFVVFIF